MSRSLPRLFAAAALSLAASAATAQISLSSAVDLALRHSPRVQMAEADVARARAAVQEVRDVYIPSVSAGGSGYGRSYGFPLGQPTLVTVQAQSLVFSFSQRDYLRSAHASFDAANFSLLDARQASAEDTVLTFLALAHDEAVAGALQQQESYAGRLVTIVQERLDAGQDTATDLTSSRLSKAQIHLRSLQVEDDVAVDRARLAHLTGVPAADVVIDRGSVPEIPVAAEADAALGAAPSPSIDAAFASARAKRQQAFGDARYLFRPQISFAAEYSRLSTFNNSNYQEYFGRRAPDGSLLPFPADAFGAGLQVTLPLLDYVHRARAREAAAEATHAEREAVSARDQFTEGRLRLQRSAEELAARAEIAALDQQLSEEQLEVLRIQLQAATTGGAPLTPKDEQNARITERNKFITFLDARLQLQQTKVSLLRQTGGLEGFLRQMATGQLPAARPGVSPSVVSGDLHGRAGLSPVDGSAASPAK